MVGHKGEEYLLKLNEFIQQENLPIEVVVIGRYFDEVRAGTKEGIIFVGEYAVNEVSQKLAQFETVLLPY